MYKNKLSKYQNKLKQYGGLSCPYKVNDQIVLTDSNDAALLYKIGTIIKIHYNVPEGAYYFNPICNKVDVNIDGKIHSVSTLDIKKISDLTPELMLSIKIDTIPPDTIKEIFKNLTMNDLIKIYNNTNRIQFREVINEYPFDFYEVPIPANMTLREFKDIFGNAIGINLTNHTNINDNDFNNDILPRTLYINSSNTRQLKVNISRCNILTDNAFIPLNNYIHTLDMSRCNQQTITDAAFVHLRNVHTLIMSVCNQQTITDAAFVYLRNVHTLDMSWCRQVNITDAAFVHLMNVHTLIMSECNQQTITDAAFIPLTNVHTLDMSYCNQETITDAAFVHLKGVHILNMSSCNQETITDAAFVHLKSVHTLDMSSCSQETITDAAFVHLKGVHTLDMASCSQETITDAAFVHLKGVHTLNMSQCNQSTITDAAFIHLHNVRNLNMMYRYRITDTVFEYLHNVHTLDISECQQITDAAFKHLHNIHTLIMAFCPQDEITGNEFCNLNSLKYLDITRCNEQTRNRAYNIFGVDEYHKNVKYFRPCV